MMERWMSLPLQQLIPHWSLTMYFPTDPHSDYIYRREGWGQRGEDRKLEIESMTLTIHFTKCSENRNLFSIYQAPLLNNWKRQLQRKAADDAWVWVGVSSLEWMHYLLLIQVCWQVDWKWRALQNTKHIPSCYHRRKFKLLAAVWSGEFEVENLVGASSPRAGGRRTTFALSQVAKKFDYCTSVLSVLSSHYSVSRWENSMG